MGILREQQLIDLCFSIGLAISNKDVKLYKQSLIKRAEWIADKLRQNGFDTVKTGSS